MVGEFEKQLSLTRAALSTGGRPKSKFQSVNKTCFGGGGRNVVKFGVENLTL
jgi:hypothetical protein